MSRNPKRAPPCRQHNRRPRSLSQHARQNPWPAFYAPNLRKGEAAELIGVSIHSREKYRCSGDDPPFLKVGSRVLYLHEEVEAWLQRHRCRNTSDDNYAAAPRSRPCPLSDPEATCCSTCRAGRK